MMTQGSDRPALPATLARTLDAVRRRDLAVRMGEFPVLLAGFIALAWLLQATADRWLELSMGVRTVLLGVDAVVALALLWFFAVGPLRRRLDRRKAALLVERTLPRFRTSLISAVELAGAKAEYPAGSRPLVERLMEEAARDVAEEDVVRKVVRTLRLKRLAIAAAFAIAAAAGCFAYARGVAPILIQRILLSQVSLPDETKVVPITADLVVVAGTDATLAARAEGKIPAAGRLVISRADGVVETIPVSPSRTEQGVFSYAARNVREGFSYRFELHDGRGAEHQVAVRVPPSLREVRFTQQYQKYTGLPDAEMSPGNLRLLAGSKLRIDASASAPLQSALLEIKGAEDVIPLPVSGEGKDQLKMELTVPDGGWKSMSIRLVAADGDPSVNDPVYRIDLVRDRVPSIQLLQPKKDSTTVVAGAEVPFVFKVSDDFGLRRVILGYRVFRPGLNGVMEPAEHGELAIPFDPAQKSFSRALDWNLSRLVPPVGTGCNITCWIEAEDHNPEKGRPASRSAEKVISIVTEARKRAELLELLGERAKDVERLYELQRTMNQKTDDTIR